ncbi:metallophosphoesterase [Sphingobacterium ginsenosidimutans]|uniref:Metallophosphoesterase n=1 Tax=Sphingobacterium ginsenosidimutans TaxID=687845 RepID=A0ABP8AAM5_9SPHI
MGIKVFLPLLFILFYSMGKAQSVIRIGLIADPQYADKDTRGSRFYRNSLDKLDSAVTAINREGVDFTVMLGDLVDVGPKDLQPALQRLNKLKSPVYNILGNHDYVDVDDGGHLYKLYKMPNPYYTVEKGEWLFILLNTNELADYATKAGSGQREAWKKINDILKTAKRNNDQPWNGGISEKQLKWMERQLHKAQSASKKVIVFTHHPLYPENGLEALNNREILTLIEKYPVVKVVISGHHHPGNFATYKGIPMITLEGMIETADRNAYGILELNDHQLDIHGEGRMTTRKIDF